MPSDKVLNVRKDLVSYQDLVKCDPDFYDKISNYENCITELIDNSRSASIEILETVFSAASEYLNDMQAEYAKKIDSAYDRLADQARKKVDMMGKAFQEISSILSDIQELSEMLGDSYHITDNESTLIRSNDKIMAKIGKLKSDKKIEAFANSSKEITGLQTRFPRLFGSSSNSRQPLTYESLDQIIKVSERAPEPTYLKQLAEYNLLPNVKAQKDSFLSIIEKILRSASLPSQSVDFLLGKSTQ